MIRYAKSAPAPASLAKGVAANAANCAAYDASPADYRSGAAKFDILGGIYGAPSVKARLKADQHDKCAFCEAIFDANVAGDVEHYRPKGAIDTDAGRVYPGYYWLAYAWANLSFACPDCNAYRKRARFPIADEAARARDHHDDVTAEAPMLLDPYGAADPRAHIEFRGEAPIARTPEAAVTIDVLGLDRVTLARDRYAHLLDLTLLYQSLQALQANPVPGALPLIERLQARLARAVEPRAKFSAAAADHLAALAAGHNYLPDEAAPAP